MSQAKKFDCSVENVPVSGAASEMADGNYYASAHISGGLTYGFVLMRVGNTKTPKYRCTQAVRLTPGKLEIMKRETPVDILGITGSIEQVFQHVIEELVKFSDDKEAPKPVKLNKTIKLKKA